YPWPARSPNGTINVASMLDMQAWFHKSKMSNAEFPADRLVDKSYVDYALSKIPPFLLENKESTLAGCRWRHTPREKERMAGERRGAAIGIAGLRKEYLSGPTRVLALDNINLRITPGEFVCIVGPSGCGKSTLLRILAGLTAPSGGTIKVDAPGWAVENAMVFQESGLFPWMSVEANVGFGLMTRGVGTEEAAARVEAALKLVGLTRFRRHYP